MRDLRRLVPFAVLSALLPAQADATPPAAALRGFGTGCYGEYASFYEHFATAAAFDLGNQGLTMVPAAGGYAVLPGLSTFITPSMAAVDLRLGDAGEVVVALAQPFNWSGGEVQDFCVHADGVVSVAPGNGSGLPTPAALLAAPHASWRSWHDYDPALGGQVLFEQGNGIVCVTWNGVCDRGLEQTASTWQIQFDCATGIVTMVWQQMSRQGGPHLVGWSPGGAALDPGSTDLSVAVPQLLATAPADRHPMSLRASGLPVLGTRLDLQSRDVPNGATAGLQVLSFTQYSNGLDLAHLGMAGCRQYIGFDVSAGFVPEQGSGAVPIAVPMLMQIAGVRVQAQSVALVPRINELGAVVSNGLELQLGF